MYSDALKSHYARDSYVTAQSSFISITLSDLECLVRLNYSWKEPLKESTAHVLQRLGRHLSMFVSGDQASKTTPNKALRELRHHIIAEVVDNVGFL